MRVSVNDRVCIDGLENEGRAFISRDNDGAYDVECWCDSEAVTTTFTPSEYRRFVEAAAEYGGLKVVDVEPEPRRLTKGDYVRQVSGSDSLKGHLGEIVNDDGTFIPYQVKFADGNTLWRQAWETVPATREEYDAAVAAHEAKKAAEAKRAKEAALIGRKVVRLTDSGSTHPGDIMTLDCCTTFDGLWVHCHRCGTLKYTGYEKHFFLVPEGDDPEPYAEAIKAAYEAAK